MNITFDYYNIDSLYYVYPDRLGSYTHITNSSKQVVRALHFDPWGNVKSEGYFHSDYLFPHTSVSSVPLYSDVIMSPNGFSMANGFKTNLIDATVRYNYKSARSWIEFRKLRDTQKAFRYNQTLGKTGAMYLKIASKTNTIVGVASASTSFCYGYAYYRNGGDDWQVYTKIGLDILMTGISFIGPVGFAISSTYFIFDVSTGGFGGFGKIR